MADKGGIRLSGVAWDHRRCWGPLDASAEPYGQDHGVAIAWNRRPLHSFGEGSLGDYLASNDLIIFDHPFVGEVAANGLLLDLNAFLSEDDRRHYAADSTGKSWPSYHYDGGVWALPIDAAAQTAAWRPDLMADLGLEAPARLEDVFVLAERARKAGKWVAWPAKPTDLACTLMTLSASLGLATGHDGEPLLDPGFAGEVIGLLKRLAAATYPAAHPWNPIQLLDHMTTHDDVVYTPHVFNYINYATLDARAVRFGPSPRVSQAHVSRTLLGGAGIGISAQSSHPRAAFDYASYLCSPDFQAGDYVRAGGQPASRTAWLSETCNAITHNFFADTLAALDDAYLRPTHNGFLPLFREATTRLWAIVFEGAPEGAFVDWLNRAHEATLPHPQQLQETGS